MLIYYETDNWVTLKSVYYYYYYKCSLFLLTDETPR